MPDNKLPPYTDEELFKEMKSVPKMSEIPYKMVPAKVDSNLEFNPTRSNMMIPTPNESYVKFHKSVLQGEIIESMLASLEAKSK